MTLELRAESIGHIPVLLGMPAVTPAPAVVWLHGLGADALANAAELERLAAEGFVAVGVDAAGHGRRRLRDLDARIAASREETFRTMLELADATARELPALVRALAGRAEVRGDRVGLVGVSMGGYAAYRALALGLDVAAAVALLGDPEWPGEERQAIVRHLSRVPLLSITAERDESVPPAGARRLHARLDERPSGADDFLHLELAGAPHLMDADDWRRAMEATVGWLRTHLQG